MRAAEAEGARGERERETKKSESLLVNSDLCSFEGAGRGERAKRRERGAKAKRAKRSGREARESAPKESFR